MAREWLVDSTQIHESGEEEYFVDNIQINEDQPAAAPAGTVNPFTLGAINLLYGKVG